MKKTVLTFLMLLTAHLLWAQTFELRLLNHWDNPDGTVERGFAGRSIWKWEQIPTGKGAMPKALRERYEEYARINQSLGINGTVLNNVNAKPMALSTPMLKKTAKIADVLRPYGIRVYLSVNFASPKALGDLATADPLEPAVQQWWQKKAKEIYRLIPDFGGFLVKANSEGEPGPMDYGRTHVDGANMLATALAPYKGIVMWRAFVYSAKAGTPTQKTAAQQAYEGDRAGLTVMGLDYSTLELYYDGGKVFLHRRLCTDADTGGTERITDSIPLETVVSEAGKPFCTVWVRVNVSEQDSVWPPVVACRFSYSLDGKRFKPLGQDFTAREGKWIGAKAGFFATATVKKNDGGSVEIY